MVDLLAACAPAVHPVTMAAIVQQESGGNAWAIGDNTARRSYFPKSFEEALEIAQRLLDQGHSLDVGLAQINSTNYGWLGVTVKDMLDPCKNLQASQRVLLDGWERSGGDLARTLSAYNTGRVNSSVGQAYAQKVMSHAGVVIPAPEGGTMARWTARQAAGAGEGGATASGADTPVRLEVQVTPLNAARQSGLSPSGSPLAPSGFGSR